MNPMMELTEAEIAVNFEVWALAKKAYETSITWDVFSAMFEVAWGDQVAEARAAQNQQLEAEKEQG
jgi:hypothetical protein